MKNKKSLLKKIIFSATFVVTMVASLVLIVFLCTREAVAISFFPHIESYSSSQGTIPSSTSSNDYISMSDANSLTTVPSGKIISISTPVEYDMFASKCESTPAFLGYHYELFSDIDFASSGIQNVLPIGYNTPFSGQFNGNGYEIKNIDLLSISTSANTDYQDIFNENESIDRDFVDYWKDQLSSFIESNKLSLKKFYDIYKEYNEENNLKPIGYQTVRNWARGYIISPNNPEELRKIANILNDEYLLENYLEMNEEAVNLRVLNMRMGRKLSSLIKNVIVNSDSIDYGRLSFEERIIYNKISNSIYQVI